MEVTYNLKLRPIRFIEELSPLQYAKQFAKKFNCDLAVPNGVGIGNVVIYTRLVEELALSLGRPIRLLTAPLKPTVGTVDNEEAYPLWEENPFIEEIVDANHLDDRIMEKIILEQDNYCQFGHIIENLCFSYNLKPRALKGSIFLSTHERKEALIKLSALKRPIICVHAGGTTSSLPSSSWYMSSWERIFKKLNHKCSFIQLGKKDYDVKPFDESLGIIHIKTTLRECMALIWASDMFLGFDSGLHHIATALGKHCIVLWDAVRKSKVEEIKETGFASSMLSRWSYPQNKNIVLLGEKNREAEKIVLHEAVHFLESLNYKETFD